MTVSADHGARDHATWAASATARNWQCAGAIALALQNPKPEVESKASAWGTACHQLAEKCFRTGKDADEFIGTVEQTKQRKIEVDEEVAETTQVYADYVRSRIKQYRDETGEDPIVYHEQALPLDKLGGPFDAGGTGDTVIYFPKWKLIEVIDLKGGRGLVEAADNKQLRTYGLGSLFALPGLNVDRVKTTIVQPRAPHKDGRIRSEEFHVADLVEWTAELLERMKLSKQALDEFGTMAYAAWCAKWLTPGNCKFCPNEGSCPALKQKALDAANVFFDDLDNPKISNAPIYDTPEELSKTLDMLDMIQDWISARRAYAHSQAEAGVVIPGYALVAKEKREVWNDGVEDVVRTACAHLPAEKYLNPAKLHTPKQVRKALGKKESLVAGLSVTPTGGTNLVSTAKTTRVAIPAAVDRFFNEEPA